MPVSPDTRRITLNLSAEQYKVLLDQAEAEGYITLLPDEANIKVTGGAVAEFLRNHLSWTIPGFMDAKPLPARGKYKRKKQRAPHLEYHCPKCDSLNTRFVGDEREPGDDPEGSDDVLLWMWFRCGDCGHKFRDQDADAEMVDEAP